MRIKNIIEPSVITEAARFGNKERNAILSKINLFRFGLEYEFNVEQGLAYLDKLSKPDTPLESPMIRDVSAHLNRIARTVTTLNSMGGIDTFDDHAASMQEYIFGGTSDAEKDYFENTVFGEVIDAGLAFYTGVILPSDEVKKVYKGKALDGMGLLNNSMTSGELTAIRNIAGYSNHKPELTVPIAMQVRSAANGLSKFLKSDAEMVSPRITHTNLHQGMLNILHAEISDIHDTTKSKVEIVRDEFPVNRRFINNILPDVTVPNGVEVITNPLSFIDAMNVMDETFEYIQRVGSTDHTTGLHVNISVSGDLDLSSINMVKMLVLLDTDFFQGLTKGAKKYIKYPVRSEWVTPMTRVLSGNAGEYLLMLARAYAYNGAASLVREFESIVTKDNVKERAVNLKHLLNADVSQRRVEFRFLGGHNYEYRASEIENDILQFCYMMAAGGSEDFLKREYLEGIVQILDRAARTTMIMGNRYGSFSTLVNAVRRGTV